MSADVIPLQLVKERLAADERANVRAALADFALERNNCAMAAKLTEDSPTTGYSTLPLSPSEVASVRRMLVEFDRVKSNCPVMFRILSERELPEQA